MLTFELHDCFLGVGEISSEEKRLVVLKALAQCLPSLHLMLLRRLMMFLDTLTSESSDEHVARLADLFAPLLFRKRRHAIESLDPSETASQRPLSVASAQSGANLKQERRVISELTLLFIRHHLELLGVRDRWLVVFAMCSILILTHSLTHSLSLCLNLNSHLRSWMIGTTRRPTRPTSYLTSCRE